MAPVPNFASHRNALLERLEDDEAVLLLGSPHHIRNGDSEFGYRPSSDVFWLTGWRDPDVAVFLKPGDDGFTLFCQPKDPERETWTGVRPGPDGAREQFGADIAHPWDKLADELPTLLQGVRRLHYAFAEDPEHDRLLTGAIRRAARAARTNGLSTPETFHAPTVLLHELRLHKSDDEIAVLREAARITAEAHRAAMAWARPGAWEYQVQSLIEFVFRSRGGVGPGYGSIVAGGDGACILHYVDNDRQLVDGDLLLIDAGCEYQFYTADVTRTFPVNGRFTEPQRRVYQWVLDAQLAAIEQARAGRPFNAMHDAAVRVLTEGMLDLGLLEGDLDTLIEEKKFKKYYMHGTGHWLGLDVHDVGAYARGGSSRTLAPGMVVTVEPGLYIPRDDETAPPELRGIGVRIEDDILVTDGEPDNLTRAIPKTIAEVEAACAEPLPWGDALAYNR